jgi:hypothetical protein
VQNFIQYPLIFMSEEGKIGEEFKITSEEDEYTKRRTYDGVDRVVNDEPQTSEKRVEKLG